MGPAKTYLTIVSLGGVFVIISNCYSNIIRAEGQAGKAMMGQLIGNLINVVLDSIMILAFDWGIAGAAVAMKVTMITGMLCIGMGQATAALIVNLSRQGIIYIPTVFIMQMFFGITGLAWAQPAADLLSLLLVAVLYVHTIRRMESLDRKCRYDMRMEPADSAAGMDSTSKNRLSSVGRDEP